MSMAESIRWKGHEAIRLGNDAIVLTMLRSGGHLADFRFRAHTELPSENVFWEAPWIAAEAPGNLQEDRLQTAGLTGHGLCLDYFGPPSASEAAAGLAIHGEAAAAKWFPHWTTDNRTVLCCWDVKLPVSHLHFQRRVRLENRETVVYIEEVVHNEDDVDRICHWVQHVTFAPPFLRPDDAMFAASATRGVTFPSAYEGGTLLKADKEFIWPNAPRQGSTACMVDLRRPFAANGYGFLAAVQFDPQRKVEFMLAINRKLGLGVGYCFLREDFPWMAIWEENCSRKSSPWNGSTQARGMEFGTTPLPLGRAETFRRGDLFGVPTWCAIPACGSRTARYVMFLFSIPSEIRSIVDVQITGDDIVIYEELEKAVLSIPAHGCKEFLFSN